jgi:preprotein translocase subunit SecG
MLLMLLQEKKSLHFAKCNGAKSKEAFMNFDTTIGGMDRLYWG